ncbi:MAG: galactokinase family protein, partial [Bacteroidota bacterium]
LYGTDQQIIAKQIKRFQHLEDDYESHFGETEFHYFSTPGRIEISGNHTDHNHGMVLAASIDLDTIAVAAKTSENEIVLYSDGYDGPFVVKLNDLDTKAEEKGTTIALLRGIASRFKELGGTIGGLHICLSSSVLPGSGLSSSASFEVLIGTVLNCLYNEHRYSPEELAAIGQYAENKYFGKPCGLMDQMACAVGGIIFIDFKDPENPCVEKVKFDFSKENICVLVVDTGGNHSDLTEDYAAIPAEMKAVARDMGATVLREISKEQFLEALPELREKHGDRAVLRSLHFIGENERVADQVASLEKGDFRKFIDSVEASGNSSYKLLQNIYTTKNVRQQGIAMALALTENYLGKIHGGACRVHGGGFAGTILVFLPEVQVKEYITDIEHVFGENCATILSFRKHGTLCLNEFN